MERTPANISTLLKLPNEIILETTKHLVAYPDVNAFASTCRCLHALLNPYLYQQSALHDNHALLWAAENGMEATTRLAIWHGANVNAAVRSGSPIIARSAKSAESSKYDVRTEIHKLEGSTPLLLAIRGCHIDIVRLLLESDDIEVNKENASKVTPLKLAIVQDHTEIFQLLLHRNDVDLHQTSLEHCGPPWSDFPEPPLTVAVSVENIQCLQWLLAEERIEVNRCGVGAGTALHMAASMRNQHMATLLLSHPDTDINARRCVWNKEYTAFDIAVYFEEDWEFAKLLLQYEAFDRGTAKGYITLALLDGHSDVVELLLPFADESVLIDAAEYTWDATLQQRSESLVQRLLERQDIDVNATDRHGRTALHWAAFNGSTSMVKILLADGRVRARQKDRNGWTALHAAMHEGHWEKGHGEVVEMLLGEEDIDLGSLCDQVCRQGHWETGRVTKLVSADPVTERQCEEHRAWATFNNIGILQSDGVLPGTIFT